MAHGQGHCLLCSSYNTLPVFAWENTQSLCKLCIFRESVIFHCIMLKWMFKQWLCFIRVGNPMNTLSCRKKKDIKGTAAGPCILHVSIQWRAENKPLLYQFHRFLCVTANIAHKVEQKGNVPPLICCPQRSHRQSVGKIVTVQSKKPSEEFQLDAQSLTWEPSQKQEQKK